MRGLATKIKQELRAHQESTSHQLECLSEIFSKVQIDLSALNIRTDQSESSIATLSSYLSDASQDRAKLKTDLKKIEADTLQKVRD